MARFKITIGVQDDKGRKGNFRYYLEVPGGTVDPLDEIEEHAQMIATSMDGVSGARVMSISATMVIPRPAGLKATATVTSDVEERVRILYLSGVRTAYKGEIPAFNHALLPPGAETFDPFAVFLAIPNTHINEMTNLVPGFTVFVVNQYGDILDFTDRGFRVFSSSKR